MLPFAYHRISQNFIHELVEKVSNGEGVVMLGPRYGGKRYMMSRLYALTRDSGIGPCVRLWLLDDLRLSTTERVVEAVRRAVVKAHGDAETLPEAPPSNDLLGPLESLAALHPHKPVFLFASNVDGMPHHLARRFLQEVRILYEAKRLIPVMSGEDDFSELVHGPNSEFTCANQYVLQGYVEGEFQTFLSHYLKYLHLKLESPEAACHRMWELTGGNLYILRIILWAIIHNRARQYASAAPAISVGEIPSEVKLTGIPGVYGEHIFRHAVQLISREPQCWEELAKLIDGETLEGFPNSVPSRLELAGIAVREESGDGARLHFASPVMEAFIKRHYDSRRFGDLYAAVGRWDEAFTYYSRIDPEERVRPSGTDDRADIEATVTALCSSFYSEVAGLDEEDVTESAIGLVKKRFAKGCHYVLGFSEVTFWQRDIWQAPGGWRYETPDTSPPGERELIWITRLLSAEENRHSRIITPEDQFRRHAAGALLPVHLNRQEAVIVSDFRNGNVISHERERLTRQVLREFIRAYAHAVDIDNFRLRQRLRDKQLNLMTEIFDELGTYGLNARTLLRKAAVELRRSDFRRRVMFCLVDEEKNRITYEVDDSEEPAPDVLEIIDWPLDNPTADIQPQVVFDKRPAIVKDARSPRYLADQTVVRGARIKAFAVVPMLNPSGKVIGTIHVEHEDGRAPTIDEVSDLMLLGRQLAIAVEQCKRVNMLESVLDNIPEPMMLLDAKERALYLNDTAATFFSGPRGFARRQDSPRLLDNLPPEIVEPVRDCFETGNRRATYIVGMGNDASFQGEVIADIIKDWRERKVGTLVRVEDRTYLVRYFDNAHLPVGARSTYEAVEKILEATKVLGHEWGRMYLVRESEDGQREFVSYLSYGGGLSPEDAKAFSNGQVNLGRESTNNWDWRCVFDERPVVFCWMEEHEKGWEYVTPHGIRVHNWPRPKQPAMFKKKPGDFWMDFPLIHDGKALGKMCLHFDENLRLNDLSLLKILSSRFAEVLSASLEREHEQETIKKSVADQMMATMAHNLHTRLAFLPAMLSRYHHLQKKYPELEPLNRDLGEIYDEIRTTVKRAKELLSPARPRLETVDLGELITKTLRRHLKDGEWEVRCEECPLEVQLDPNQFATALLELIQNSRDAVMPPEALLVSVKAETVRGVTSGEHVLVTFRDNGPGVPLEVGQKIFEDFYSQRSNAENTGTGLGLGFVRRVVEAHGGHVFYNDSLGDGRRGAEFWIQIPRFAEARVQEEKTSG